MRDAPAAPLACRPAACAAPAPPADDRFRFSCSDLEEETGGMMKIGPVGRMSKRPVGDGTGVVFEDGGEGKFASVGGAAIKPCDQLQPIGSHFDTDARRWHHNRCHAR